MAVSGAANRFFLAALAVGLIVRLATLAATSGLDTHIEDEQHYRQLAGNLVDRHEFAFRPGAPTSLRPPFYPALIASIWTVTGRDNLQSIRAVQIVLAMLTAGLVYVLGRRAFNPKVARVAAAAYWLYPGLVVSNFLILTETLFTALLLVFLWLAVMLVQSPAPRSRVALACGVALGLAALTRSVLWPLPLVLCPLMAVAVSGSWRRRLTIAAAIFAGYAMTVGPWAIRNTRLQGVPTVIDTMGGLNLRMGNYEHTPEDRMWDAVSLSGDPMKTWVAGINDDFPNRLPTEGEKDKWAQRKALEYMSAHPLITARRAAIKFADFWGLEREFLAGIKQGFFRPPTWAGLLISIAIVISFPLVAVAAAAGVWLTPASDWRVQTLLLLPIVAITAVHSIVFGHSRYHLPLVPLLLLFGTAAVLQLRHAKIAAASARTGAVVTMLLLSAIWLRQILVVDLRRIQAFFGG